jgi:hypothetical protein
MKLTGNDIALAQEAVTYAIGHWKKQGRSKFVREQVEKFKSLNEKLNEINKIAYPYESADDMPHDIGDEEIMKLDEKVVRKTRKAALKQRTIQ